jgi:hypothetical protein
MGEVSIMNSNGDHLKGMALAEMPGRIFALKTYYLQS